MRTVSLAPRLTMLAAPAIADAARPIPGDILVDARLRDVSVSQDGVADTAQALTLRTRPGNVWLTLEAKD